MAQDTEETRYRVTFDRVGRNHNVEPIEVGAANPDQLAAEIWLRIRNKLASRDTGVTVDMDNMAGMIHAGVRNAGEFAIEVLP